MVAGTITEFRCAVCGFAERPVERGGILDGVRKERGFGEAFFVERFADRADSAVHHVARGHDVGPRARVAEGRFSENFQCCVVVDDHALRRLAEDAAMTVLGVLVDAHVGDDEQLGGGVFHCGDGARHGALRIVGAGTTVIFGGRQAEEDHSAELQCRALFRDSRSVAHGKLEDAGHRTHGFLLVEGCRKEEREDEIIRCERRLAHEGANGRGAAQAARALNRKHARSIAKTSDARCTLTPSR